MLYFPPLPEGQERFSRVSVSERAELCRLLSEESTFPHRSVSQVNSSPSTLELWLEGPSPIPAPNGGACPSGLAILP